MTQAESLLLAKRRRGSRLFSGAPELRKKPASFKRFDCPEYRNTGALKDRSLHLSSPEYRRMQKYPGTPEYSCKGASCRRGLRRPLLSRSRRHQGPSLPLGATKRSKPMAKVVRAGESALWRMQSEPRKLDSESPDGECSGAPEKRSQRMPLSSGAPEERKDLR